MELNQYLNNNFEFNVGLANRNGEYLNDIRYAFKYVLEKDYLRILISGEGEYILPLVNGELEVEVGNVTSEEDIFFLTPGFIAKEYRIKSVDGTIILKIK